MGMGCIRMLAIAFYDWGSVVLRSWWAALLIRALGMLPRGRGSISWSARVILFGWSLGATQGGQGIRSHCTRWSVHDMMGSPTESPVRRTQHSFWKLQNSWPLARLRISTLWNWSHQPMGWCGDEVYGGCQPSFSLSAFSSVVSDGQNLNGIKPALLNT